MKYHLTSVNGSPVVDSLAPGFPSVDYKDPNVAPEPEHAIAGYSNTAMDSFGVDCRCGWRARRSFRTDAENGGQESKSLDQEILKHLGLPPETPFSKLPIWKRSY